MYSLYLCLNFYVPNISLFNKYNAQTHIIQPANGLSIQSIPAICEYVIIKATPHGRDIHIYGNVFRIGRTQVKQYIYGYKSTNREDKITQV